MALNVIMLGAPGAGKGTQAERFARGRGIPRISTGDILREAVDGHTEIGRRAKERMMRGELVSDDVMIGIMRERLEKRDAVNGFVLDGFPRTVTQAAALDELMEGRDPLIVIDLVVPETELVRRLATRLICEDCGATSGGLDEKMGASTNRAVLSAGAAVLSAEAAVLSAEAVAAVRAQSEPLRCHRCGGRLVQRVDDDEAVVRERLKVYRRDTKPLVASYRGRQTFRSINGAETVDQVAGDLAAAIEAAGNGLQ